MFVKLVKNKKQVRFLNDLQTFTYSFPCDVCDFETARKRELEEHFLTRHEIIVSFTHSTGRPRNRLAKISHIVEENVDTAPKVSHECYQFIY